MIEAINDGFRRFLDFRGRSNKLQYNSFLLFYVLTDLFLSKGPVEGRGIVTSVIAAAAPDDDQELLGLQRGD